MKSSAPMLFDKLSLNRRRIHLPQWRDVLLRDIELLLNDAAHSASLALDKKKHCINSVINYGLPTLSAKVPVNTDPIVLAKKIQQIIATFEPRLDPRSIRVTPFVNKNETWTLALLFDIYAKTNLPGEDLTVNLRIALDYSYGSVRVI